MRFPRISGFFHISESGLRCRRDDVCEDEVMESVSGAQGNVWPVFPAPATWGVWTVGGGVVENLERGKQEGFINQKINSNYLLILKKSF